MAEAKLGDEADLYEAMVANERVEGWMDALQEYVGRPGDPSASSRAKRAAQELAEAASRSAVYEEVRLRLDALLRAWRGIRTCDYDLASQDVPDACSSHRSGSTGSGGLWRTCDVGSRHARVLVARRRGEAAVRLVGFPGEPVRRGRHAGPRSQRPRFDHLADGPGARRRVARWTGRTSLGRLLLPLSRPFVHGST
eukprot:scaffold867_cov317-Pavlova_lutheri.AAC.3